MGTEMAVLFRGRFFGRCMGTEMTVLFLGDVFWWVYGNREGGFVPGRCFGGSVVPEVRVLFWGGGGDTGIDCVMGDEGFGT